MEKFRVFPSPFDSLFPVTLLLKGIGQSQLRVKLGKEMCNEVLEP